MNFMKNINDAYEDYLENYNKSSEIITDTYQNLHGAFDEYLNAIQEREWKAGFNYAMRLVMGGKDAK